jgi:hypothetical protein
MLAQVFFTCASGNAKHQERRGEEHPAERFC